MERLRYAHYSLSMFQAPRSLRVFAVREFVVLALLLSFASSAPAFASSASGIRLEQVHNGKGIGHVVGLVFPGDGTDRLFVVQQTGEIGILKDGVLHPQPFLDVSDRVVCCDNERGLLGLAFHPDFADNGYFFIVYVDERSKTVVSRFTVTSDPDVADGFSEEEIISWDQPDLFHNGGAIQFGPDGHLYLGSGDGGTRDAAGELDNVLGTILRIDVDSAFPYAIPADNPFVGDTESRGEIWVYGLRNPWRFTFDRETGDVYIGDVGSTRVEEIDFQAAGSPGGDNFGWPIMEGDRCNSGEAESGCDNDGLVAPIISYPHEDGTCNSVTGGYRYRGPSVPTLEGSYLFSDFCRGRIWGARRNRSGNWVVNELLKGSPWVTTFGEDDDGILYLARYGGDIYRIVGQSLFEADFETGHPRRWSRRRGAVAVIPRGLRRSDYALEIGLRGRRAFVRSKHPSAETTFRLGLDLRLDEVKLEGGSAEILRLADRRKVGHLKLTLERIDGDYRLNLLVRPNEGRFTWIGRTSIPRSRTVRIELDWMAATGPDVLDGQVSLSKNGRLRVFAANLDTHGKNVDSVTVGLRSAISGSGSILIDNYVSTP